MADSIEQSPPVLAAGADALAQHLYNELSVIARREYRHGGGPMTLQPTALIGEAYLKIRGRNDWASEQHFLGCAATAMRHVIIDAARARLATKRGGQRESLTIVLGTTAEPVEDLALVRLSDALDALGKHDPSLAKLVEYRFFIGLDEAETARQMNVTDRTVRRWWVRARAWIHSEMTAED